MSYGSSIRAAAVCLVAILIATCVGAALFGAWFVPAGTIAFLAVAVAFALEFTRRQFSTLRTLSERVSLLIDERDDVLREMDGLVYLYTRLQPDLPLPSFNKATIRPDFAERLAGEVMSRVDPVVVELGSGVSTAIVGLCLKKLGSGRILSHDHEAKYAELTGRMLADHKVTGCAGVSHSPLREVMVNGKPWQWYDLDASKIPGQIDMLIVDGPPGDTGPLARYPALPLLYDKLKPGAMIYLDDGRRPDEQEVAARWQREYPGLQLVRFPTRSGVIAFRKG